MPIQDQLRTALAGVAGGRVYPHVAPDGVTKPYVTYFRLSVVPVNTLANGRPLENTIFQIDCYDKTAAGVNSVKEAVKTALDAWSVKWTLQSEQDLYEPDTKLHRISIDASVFS